MFQVCQNYMRSIGWSQKIHFLFKWMGSRSMQPVHIRLEDGSGWLREKGTPNPPSFAICCWCKQHPGTSQLASSDLKIQRWDGVSSRNSGLKAHSNLLLKIYCFSLYRDFPFKISYLPKEKTLWIYDQCFPPMHTLYSKYIEIFVQYWKPAQDFFKCVSYM